MKTTCEHCGHTWGYAESDVEYRHHVMCGDCMDEGNVESVLHGRRADLCLTDPPYGVGENYQSYIDSDENLKKLIDGFLLLARKHSSVVLLTSGNKNHRLYPKPTWELCWFVAAGTGSGPWVFICWQPILAYGGDPYLKAGKGSRPDAFALTQSADNAIGHPCSKPVAVWCWIMERGSVNKGDIVFDPFIGSGTTIIAAEQIGRVVSGIEIDPGYVAVVLQRFQDFTGETPRLIEGE